MCQTLHTRKAQELLDSEESVLWEGRRCSPHEFTYLSVWTALCLCGYVFECLLIVFERKCQNQCPVTCVNHVYNLNVIADRHKWPQALKDSFLRAAISWNDNQLPDQTTRHTPAVSFVQFISGFSGLMGMWLGLSAVTVLNYLLKYFLLWLNALIF